MPNDTCHALKHAFTKMSDGKLPLRELNAFDTATQTKLYNRRNQVSTIVFLSHPELWKTCSENGYVTAWNDNTKVKLVFNSMSRKPNEVLVTGLVTLRNPCKRETDGDMEAEKIRAIVPEALLSFVIPKNDFRMPSVVKTTPFWMLMFGTAAY